MANYPTFRKKRFYDKREPCKKISPENLFDSINEEESEEIDLGPQRDAILDEIECSIKGVLDSEGLYNWVQTDPEGEEDEKRDYYSL